MASEVTPPRSFLEPPLTPPLTKEKALLRAAQRVLNYLKLHRAGHRPQFERVYGNFTYARWYDYDPCRSCLTIRMPSPLHDVFCAKIVGFTTMKQFQ
ncbi:hypothetical protein HAV15_011268 [Penicillium sp. str. |nr:hypothetical protein HAV15_011268 [Penicillium sp. str. \